MHAFQPYPLDFFETHPFEKFDKQWAEVVVSDGNPLQWLYGGIYKQNADGTATYKIMVLYENQTDLTFEVTNKNVDGKEIASIDFQIH